LPDISPPKNTPRKHQIIQEIDGEEEKGKGGGGEGGEEEEEEIEAIKSYVAGLKSHPRPREEMAEAMLRIHNNHKRRCVLSFIVWRTRKEKRVIGAE